MKVGIIGAGRQGWRRAEAIDVSRDDITFVSDIDTGGGIKQCSIFSPGKYSGKVKEKSLLTF